MDIGNILIDCVKNKTPVSFSKYGDGEYLCASGTPGHNCDNDNYTEKLRYSLIFKNESNFDIINTFIFNISYILSRLLRQSILINRYF